jgi:apolipoprotein D and lipocalin family protein
MNQTLSALLLLLLAVSLAGKGANPVATVRSVDLQRYLGTWYQLAYFPNSFQPRDCGLTVARYSLDKKKNIVVDNTCYEDAAGTKVKRQATGKAKTVDATNSKLKVTFFWPFYGDYWIVKLDEQNYTYSVVSDPKRKYLWILTRTPEVDRKLYQDLTAWLQRNGWDTSRLVVTGKLK